MAHRELKKRLKDFRAARQQKEELEDFISREQRELVGALDEADPDRIGLVYDPSDESKGAAYLQQNSPSEYWDEEAIVAWLRKRVAGRKTVWLACSTRILDIKKLEAEIAAGNIPVKTAEKWKKTGTTPKPFIRWGKITKKNQGT
jgi:hypothetical protein